MNFEDIIYELNGKEIDELYSLLDEKVYIDVDVNDDYRHDVYIYKKDKIIANCSGCKNWETFAAEKLGTNERVISALDEINDLKNEEEQLFNDFIDFISGIQENDRVYLIDAVRNYASMYGIEERELNRVLSEKCFGQMDYLYFNEEKRDDY